MDDPARHAAAGAGQPQERQEEEDQQPLHQEEQQTQQQQASPPAAAARRTLQRRRASSAAADANVGKEKARQRTRAIALINKHAGTYAREGQKTKWIVDLVIKVDDEYKRIVTAQGEHIGQLQKQLEELRDSSGREACELGEQLVALQCHAGQLEAELLSTTSTLHTVQEHSLHMQESLRCAEEAAAAATSECATLAEGVRSMTEQDARARCCLANRAHHLREALLQTSAALREFNNRDRQARHEKELRLREKEKALAAERTALLDRAAEQQALQQALETMQLRYHLAVLKIRELRAGAGASAAAAAVPAGPSGTPPCGDSSAAPAADQGGAASQGGGGGPQRRRLGSAARA